MKRASLLSLALVAALWMSACGGGGSSSSNGGGNNGGSNNGGTTTRNNTVPITVGPGPSTTSPYTNGVFVSVTVCVPGSTSCTTVPNVLLDTGSSGLRLLAGSVAGLNLPALTSGSSAIADCTQYVDLSYNWGPVVKADVKMADEVASSLPIHIIADPTSSFPQAPSSCSNGGTASNTIDSLGANGIIGLSSYLYDCGSACAPGTTSNGGVYFACSGASCSETTVSLANQVQNPVALFANDNNGLSLTLPAIADSGAPSVTGTLTFGIGTLGNNTPSGVTLNTPDNFGNITTTYNGHAYTSSFIDSGSNAIYFLSPAETGMPECTTSTGFYCPASITSFTAANRGQNGASKSVTFKVTNADHLSMANWAFSDLAGLTSNTSPQSGLPTLYFDWGLPFFFGKTVYVGINGKTSTLGTGPYWAY